MKKQIINYVILATVLPSFAYAATNMKLSDLVSKIAGYFNQALFLMVGFAVVMFVWNVIAYFIQPAQTKKSEAAQYVMWSVIGFFVILSIWGIVNVLISTFDLGTGSPTSWTGINNLFPH